MYRFKAKPRAPKKMECESNCPRRLGGVFSSYKCTEGATCKVCSKELWTGIEGDLVIQYACSGGISYSLPSTCSCLEDAMCRLCTRASVVDTVKGLISGTFYPACPSMLSRICSQYQDYLRESEIKGIREYLERLCTVPHDASGHTPGLIRPRFDAMLKRCHEYFEKPLRLAWSDACIKPARRKE